MPKKLSDDVISINGRFYAPLSRLIQERYNALLHEALNVSEANRTEKTLNLSGHMVSVNEVIAYQIGWGKLLIGWYEAGINGSTPVMPGEGFITWDYKGLALHFYEKCCYSNVAEQHREFKSIVSRIIEIVEKEFETENLDKEAVWSWCTLKSGKQWPLGKWVQVNTAAPYKRACDLIKKFRNSNNE